MPYVIGTDEAGRAARNRQQVDIVAERVGRQGRVDRVDALAGGHQLGVAPLLDDAPVVDDRDARGL